MPITSNQARALVTTIGQIITKPILWAFPERWRPLFAANTAMECLKRLKRSTEKPSDI